MKGSVAGKRVLELHRQSPPGSFLYQTAAYKTTLDPHATLQAATTPFRLLINYACPNRGGLCSRQHQGIPIDTELRYTHGLFHPWVWDGNVEYPTLDGPIRCVSSGCDWCGHIKAGRFTFIW